MASKKKQRKENKERKRISARKRAEEHKSGFQNTALNIPKEVEMFGPKKAGVYRIEIIPYVVPKGAGNPNMDDGEPYFERTYWRHPAIGPDNSNLVCPKKTVGKKCPICEEWAQMNMDPDATKDAKYALKPRERQLWNVFDYGEPDKGVQIWDVSYAWFGELVDDKIKLSEDDDDEDRHYEYYADKEDGLTLKLGMKDNVFLGKTSQKCVSVDFKKRREPIDPELFDASTVLDDLLIIEPYDKIKAIFLQTEDEDDDDDEPQEKLKSVEELSKSDDFDMEKGDKVKHDKHGVCTIAKISGDGTSLTLIDKEDELHKGVGPDEVEKVKANKDKTKKEKSKPKKEEKDDDEWDDNDDDFEDEESDDNDDDSWEED